MSDSSPPLPIQIDHHAGLTLVRVRPALVTSDWSTTEQAADQVVRELEPTSPPRCVIDLSDLDYLGSSQVAFIVRVWKSVQSANGHFAVACPKPVVIEVLRLAGLDKLLAILPTRDAAVRSLTPAPGKLGAGSQKTLAVIALLGALVASIGAGLSISGRAPPHVAKLVEYCGAVVGLLLGCCVVLLGGGRARVCGVIAIVVTLAALLTTLWPHLQTPPP